MNLTLELPCRSCGKPVPVTIRYDPDLLDVFEDRIEYVCHLCAKMLIGAETVAFMRHLAEKQPVSA